jgi:predicted MFS family arabinose efflux permease
VSAPGVANLPTGSAGRYRYYVLFILVIVYTLNFVDRVILGVLVPPIKAELQLTDTQLGLLGGTAFALFYTALGIPIGALADRVNRVWIVTLALTLWSGFTAVCGSVQNFTQLFLARLGVGVGEAGGVAPSYSLVADYFPPSQRARALAVYAFGIPIGSALGLLFGGLIASWINWRVAFFAVGAVGLLAAPLLRLTVREPRRGGLDLAADGTSSTPVAAPRISEVLRLLARKRSFWGLSFGGAASSIMAYGALFWLPSFFVRSYGLSLVEVSVFYSAITLVGGVAGIWLGGVLADRFGAASRSAYALVPAIAFLLTVPFYVIGVLAPALTWASIIFVIPVALGLVWLGPTTAAIQHLVRPEMRAVASAIFLFVNNLIGLGCGSLLIGALSDAMSARFGDDALRYAILAGSSFYLLAALLFYLSSRRLERDWETGAPS